MALDPATGTIASSSEEARVLEQPALRGGPFGYVVAAWEGGAKDVLPQYAGALAESRKLRDEEWWREVACGLA